MIEYLYNAIRATAGQDITIAARITEEDNVITSQCSLMLHSDNDLIASVEGIYLDGFEQWEFTIPASISTGLKGRYWYCICHNGNNICFKEPIYLV